MNIIINLLTIKNTYLDKHFKRQPYILHFKDNIKIRYPTF